MIELETKRLIIKSDAYIAEGELKFQEKPHVVDLLDIKPSRVEECGFALYLKQEMDQVGHVTVIHHRRPYELTVGMDESYRQNGYMTEGLKQIIDWLFKNCTLDKLTAIRGNIIPEASRRLLLRCGFEQETTWKDADWYVLKRDKWEELSN